MHRPPDRYAESVTLRRNAANGNLLIRRSPSPVHRRPQPSTQPETQGFRFHQRPQPSTPVHTEWLPTWLPGARDQSKAHTSGQLDVRKYCAHSSSVVFHFDRGSQYTAGQFGDLCSTYGVLQSAGRTGVCWHNATAESFLAALKKEYVRRRTFRTHTQAQVAIRRWIEAVTTVADFTPHSTVCPRSNGRTTARSTTRTTWYNLPHRRPPKPGVGPAGGIPDLVGGPWRRHVGLSRFRRCLACAGVATMRGGGGGGDDAATRGP